MNDNLSAYENIQRYIKRVKQNSEAWKKEMAEEALKKLKAANEKIRKEYGVVQREKIKEIYNQTADMFYKDYSPDIYKRQKGLMQIKELSLQYDKYGRVSNDTFESFFDDVQMHADRRGNVYWRRNGYFESLFDLTYMHGWHGGAPSSEDGDHPSSGTPYYRTPHPYYYEWGDRAEQMSPSPFEHFKELLLKADSSGGELRRELRRIRDEQYEKMAEDIRSNILPVVSRKYFGKL